ncbi:uncharacterized protein LOC143450601 [Clavelina lepadiformis]|uniref:uncharacterized protein LOC143450601 n=1 Tax=Clavelina lepadiformis TaxID=159417 RepID=UPI0040426865
MFKKVCVSLLLLCVAKAIAVPTGWGYIVPDPEGRCTGRESPDHFAIPGICDKFYRCVYGYLYEHQCPDGLVFNPSISVCDWPRNVRGCEDGGDKPTYVGFVLDDSGSMISEISAVKQWMQNCVSGSYATCASAPTGGWIVSTFNDPYPSGSSTPYPPTFPSSFFTRFGPSTDASAVVDFIDDIAVHSGYDCPEYAFFGNKNALDVIPDDNGGCKIFFFSDATAKDPSSALAPLITQFAAKGCSFIPVLTGCCHRCEDPCASLDSTYCHEHVVDDRSFGSSSGGFEERAYYDLAYVTGGSIYLTDKASADDLLKFLEDKITLGFCPTTSIAGPLPEGYTSKTDCESTGSCWDSSVGKCYCSSANETCSHHPIVKKPKCLVTDVHTFKADPEGCARYYECASGRQWNRPCAPGTVFDPAVGVCNHPYLTAPPCGTKTD